MFEDRKDAGVQLAYALEKFKDKDCLVLGVPRGCAEIGYEVARYLNADFSLIVARKLPFPYNPEAGFGALSEGEGRYIFQDASSWIPDRLIKEIIENQKQEIKRRIQELRNGEPLPEMEGKTVILVDDGIAMGSTVRAAIETCKNMNPGKIVVGAPVTSKRVADEIGMLVDEVVVLYTPPFFQAVAQVYRHWHDVSDEEVNEIMRKWNNR